MKKTKLENQQQVWKGCKKTTGQTESMAHSENMVCRLSTHRKKPLQFLLKKLKPKNEAYNIPRIGRSGSSINKTLLRKNRLTDSVGRT